LTLSLVLRVLLTPVLVGSVTLMGRKWGATASGWLMALPLTSAPIIVFVAVDRGPGLAADVAAGALAGVVAVAGFCLAYAWTARVASWRLSALVGTLSFGALGLAVPPLAPWPLLFVAFIAVAIAFMLLPKTVARETGPRRYPRWDIPLRAAIATALVVGVTELAPLVGGRVSGVIATYPVYVSVLAAFAHHASTGEEAIAVLRGVLLGLYGLVAFFFVLAAFLEVGGLLLAFTGGLVVLLLVHTLTFQLVRSRYRAVNQGGGDVHVHTAPRGVTAPPRARRGGP
jgi:hypothetical protein